jgi:hypothetical protein
VIVIAACNRINSETAVISALSDFLSLKGIAPLFARAGISLIEIVQE